MAVARGPQLRQRRFLALKSMSRYVRAARVTRRSCTPAALSPACRALARLPRSRRALVRLPRCPVVFARAQGQAIVALSHVSEKAILEWLDYADEQMRNLQRGVALMAKCGFKRARSAHE